MSDDLAHDAHLRAALRHAPDHALAPPSGLSQAILTAARRAHRPARPTPAPPPVRMRAARGRPLRARLHAWLRRLFAPRWAGAWAAGLVATLGVGLWLDLEWRPALDRPAVVAMNSPRPDSAAAVETPREATPAGSPEAADASPAATKPAPVELARKAVPADTLGKLRATPSPDPRVAESADQRRNDAAVGAAQQRAAENESRDEAARRQSAAPEPATPAAVAAAPAVPAASEPTLAPRRSESSVAGLRAALPEAAKAAESEAATVASPALTLLRRAQAELASGNTTWTWSPPGTATMLPFDDAGRDWLSRVVQAARGRWVDAGERGESQGALEVRWWRDGWPHATLRIEADGLRWIEPGGRIRFAPLDTATLQQLRTH